MAVAQTNPDANGDFAARVGAAQKMLTDSIARAGLTNDPYRHTIEGLAGVVGVFPDLVRRLEAVGEPVPKSDLIGAVYSGTMTANRDLFFQVRLRNWLIGAGIGIAALAAVGWSGWFLGWYHTKLSVSAFERTMSGAEAQKWRWIIANNPLDRVNQSCWQDGNRKACSFALWVEPEPPPPATH